MMKPSAVLSIILASVALAAPAQKEKPRDEKMENDLIFATLGSTQLNCSHAR